MGIVTKCRKAYRAQGRRYAVQSVHRKTCRFGGTSGLRILGKRDIVSLVQ